MVESSVLISKAAPIIHWALPARSEQFSWSVGRTLVFGAVDFEFLGLSFIFESLESLNR